ncbi:MAG TPA: TonB-dependent receptor, partial [Kofleriaceae bacterium]
MTSSAFADGETIVVVGKVPDSEADRDRDRALGDAPFVTVIHSDDHAATESVADAIGATVGAQTRSLGGLGAFESVTVRGASPGHTEVLVDGIPLARIAAVTQDLGRFALGSFGQVELYRGAVPIELGGAGVGGALNLVTRLGRDERGNRITASLGYGSFGARHLRAHYGDSHGDHWASSTTLGYQGATGDYTYFSDNGTQLNLNDDSYKTRTNNAFDQVDLASRVGRTDRPTAYGVRFAYRDQGLPGSANQPTLAASLSTLDAIGDARGALEFSGGNLVAKQVVYGLVERQALRDPNNELGLGAAARDYLTLSGGASSTWVAALDRHRLTAGIELRADRFTDRDSDGASAALIGTRYGGAALVAFDLAVDRDARFVITPGFRFDVERTKPATNTMPPASARTDTIPSPRLSARAALTDDMAVKGSVGAYERMPTLIELFGDRGTVTGSPDLHPETGSNVDAGIVLAPAHAIAGTEGEIDRVMIEAAGFATRIHDTIALVPYAGSSAFHAENIADAMTYGGELVMSARLHHVATVTANYTHLETQQISDNMIYDGKALPRQPADAVYARIDGNYDRYAGYFDASFQAQTFLDQANLAPLPARILLGAGA